jgi:hypothetical protein
MDNCSQWTSHGFVSLSTVYLTGRNSRVQWQLDNGEQSDEDSKTSYTPQTGALHAKRQLGLYLSDVRAVLRVY